jgi:hypothetical protein
MQQAVVYLHFQWQLRVHQTSFQYYCVLLADVIRRFEVFEAKLLLSKHQRRSQSLQFGLGHRLLFRYQDREQPQLLRGN